MRWTFFLSGMLRPYAPVALFCSCLFLFSCENSNKNIETDFVADIDTVLLKKHLYVLADPKMEGRETATAGEKQAAFYIEKVFKSLNLETAVPGKYIIPFMVYRDSIVQAGLQVNNKTYLRYRDFDVYPNYAHKHHLVLNKTVFAGYGIETKKTHDYAGLDVRDAVVVVNDGEPMQDSLYVLSGTKERSRMASVREKLKNATKHRAAALFVIKEEGWPLKENFDNWGRLYLEADKNEQPIPVYFISKRLGKILLHPDQKTTIGIQDSCKTISMESRNVMAVLPGTDKKNEYVFITGHYDHLGKKGDDIYCGADDNASGTTGVLAIAKAFADARKAGKGPRRSMVFMLVSGEEKGLLGSRYYTSHPVFPMEKTSVDLNIDMIGRVGKEYTSDKDSLNYIYVIGDDKLSSELEPLTLKCNRKTKLKIDHRYNNLDDPNRFYFRSDHYNFAKKGVPIIFYFNGVHRDYHRPGDTREKINFALMRQRALLVFYTAREMANMNHLLKRDLPLQE